MKLLIKNVLIVYKKTFFESVFLNKDKKQEEIPFTKSEISHFRSMHDEHYKTLDQVVGVLKKFEIKYEKTQRRAGIDYQKRDLVITVGGDGTFLHAARNLRKQMILGVNSDPVRSVGRLCLTMRDSFEDIFCKILLNKRAPILIQRLSVVFKKKKMTSEVINDILICDQNPAAMSRYELNINSVKEYQRSSGIWFSTSVGSTGAIHSAGSKKVKLLSDKFLYQPRELYYCKNHSYQLKGGVFNISRPVGVRSSMTDGVVYLDGAHYQVPFHFGDQIQIVRSKYPLKTFL